MRLVWLRRNGNSRLPLPLIPNAYKYCKRCLSARDTTHRKLLRRAIISRVSAWPKRVLSRGPQSVGSAHTFQVTSYPRFSRALTPHGLPALGSCSA